MTTDKDLDQMYEAAVADEWEDRNNHSFPEWKTAVESMTKVGNWLKDTVATLNEAAHMVNGSSEEDRILSIASEISFLMEDLRKQTERMKTA